MKAAWLVCALVCLIVGCTEPRLDCSSEAAFIKSMAKVTESLPKDKQEEFAGAVMSEGVSESMAATLEGQTLDSVQCYRKIDGMTAKEVMAKVKADFTPKE